MKLSKKRISILISLLCFLLVLVFTLCSFDFPVFDPSIPLLSAIPNLEDCENIISIVDLQSVCGTFNSLVPILIYYDYYSSLDGVSQYRVLVIFTLPTASFTISTSISIGNYTVQGSGETLVLATLTSSGFADMTIRDKFTVNQLYTISYRRSSSVPLVFNTGCSISSSTVGQDSIIDVHNYWIDYYDNLLIGADEVVSAFNDGFDSGYFDGLESGLEWGEELGYQNGYSDGVGTGYSQGYQQGEAAGYETGYEDGYSDGYDTGYSEAERETVIEYVEPFEIDIGRVISGISSVPDNIMNGSFDFELFGINVYGLLKLLIILFVVSAIVVFIIKRAS